MASIAAPPQLAGYLSAGWRPPARRPEIQHQGTTPSRAAIIRFATLAPNGHNTQPWRFRVDDRRIAILPDLSRRTPVVDPDDHHLFVSLGCAPENLALASGARGRPGELSFNPVDGGSVLLTAGGAATADPALFEAIPGASRRAPTTLQAHFSTACHGEREDNNSSLIRR
jgi:hypothetical protein